MWPWQQTQSSVPAIALMEWKVDRDDAGVKIFERGARLFPEEEYFVVEYLQFLHSRDDFTSKFTCRSAVMKRKLTDDKDARVVFENRVKRMAAMRADHHEAGPGGSESMWAQRSPTTFSPPTCRRHTHVRRAFADVTQHPSHGRNSPRPQSPLGASRGQTASAGEGRRSLGFVRGLAPIESPSFELRTFGTCNKCSRRRKDLDEEDHLDLCGVNPQVSAAPANSICGARGRGMGREIASFDVEAEVDPEPGSCAEGADIDQEVVEASQAGA